MSENRNKTNIKPICIIGSGPAAYSTALYLKSDYDLFEGKTVGVNGPGGQLTTTTHVDNYPGFPESITGPQLIKNMQSQLKGNVISETVTKLTKNDNFFEVTADNNAYKYRCVIIASGAQAKRLYVKGTNDNEFWQKGVSACAVCDGFAYRRKTVIVIGGGDTAMEEANHLSGIAAKVILVHRRKEFRARFDMLKRVKDTPNIEIITDFELQEVYGEKFMNGALFKHAKTNEIIDLKADGLFFSIGHSPNTSFCSDQIKLDDHGYIVTDKDGQCNLDGLYAAGDVQDKVYRQAITAAASGCLAGISAQAYYDKNLPKFKN